MRSILTYEQIDRSAWSRLVQTSATGTWFQTPEAYDFFASQPTLFKPFAYGLINDQLPMTNYKSQLHAVCVGYVTVEKSALKQFMTRRAIIVGGPALANDATDEEVYTLMKAVVDGVKCNVYNPIYIETRNFNDYSCWKEAFAVAGFNYQPHLNFHVDTSSVDVVEVNLGKSRKRDIKTTIREGVSIVPIDNVSCMTYDVSERERMVHEYYLILKNLYETKVKTPLFPESFFQALAKHPDGRILLTVLNGKVIGGTACVELANKCVYEWFACGEDGVYPHVFPSCYATYAGIRYAAEHNCPRFDMMGAGKPDEAYGVRDFKAKFGGHEVEHGRFVYVAKPLLYKLGILGVKILKTLK